MKKALAIILATVLLFSLAALFGCSTTEDKPSDSGGTSAPPASQVPKENEPENKPDYSGLPMTKYWGKSVPELIEEGETPLVGLTFPVLSDPFLVQLVGALEENLKKAGLNPNSVSAEAEITNQINQIENFTTMGAVAIIEGAMSIEALVTANTAAIEAGVIITSLGSKPINYDISGGIANDYADLGRSQGKMIIAYLDKFYPDAAPGSILTAFCQNSNLETTLLCSGGMKETIQADPRINIIYEKDLVMEIDTGYTFAEEALTFDPNITLLAMYMEASAIGANNYIASLPNVDFSKYAIFCTSGGDELSTIIEMAKEDKAAIRGTIKYGGLDPSESMFRTTHDMLFGLHEVPYWVPEPHWSENSFDWQLEDAGERLQFD